MLLVLSLPPDMAPTVSTPSMLVMASITASAVAKASSFSVSAGTVTVIESWLEPISGMSTTPMVAMRQTDTASSTIASVSGMALRFKQKRKSFSYPFRKQSNQGCLISFCLRSTVEPAQGTTVRATMRDASRLNVMVHAISESNSSTMPVVNTMGRNTQTVVRVEDTMAPATWRAPCTAARGAGMPRPRRR